MTDAVNCQSKLPNTSRSRRLLFASRNTTDWKVFLQLHSLQVIETSQSAIARHDGTEGDRVKRLREILFLFFCIILGELYLCVTLPAVLSLFWECGTFRPPLQRAFRCYLQDACGATRPANGNELAVIAAVAALITVYLTAVLSQLTPSCGRWEGVFTTLALFKP